LKGLLCAIEFQALRHKRHYVRLGYSLLFGNRQRMIAVSLVPERFIQEQMPRHLSHRFENPLIVDAARRDLGFHHAFTSLLEVHHADFSSLTAAQPTLHESPRAGELR